MCSQLLNFLVFGIKIILKREFFPDIVIVASSMDSFIELLTRGMYDGEPVTLFYAVRSCWGRNMIQLDFIK